MQFGVVRGGFSYRLRHTCLKLFNDGCWNWKMDNRPIRSFTQIEALSICVYVCSFVKPPLATARAASCNGCVHLFVCLFVCLSVCRQIAKTRFLPRDAMQALGLCRHAVSVCLSVCSSVTFVSSVKTNKRIIKIFPPSGSHAILVFLCQTA